MSVGVGYGLYGQRESAILIPQSGDVRVREAAIIIRRSREKR
jgi:hypothetical protein